jgi:C4-dicarboxylate-specific signal transduction histidine kinase
MRHVDLTAHLQQALLNVIINAEHAVLGGGSARRIEITTAINQPRKNVTVTFRDYGPGIAADVMPRIFDPFFTTKPIGEGTGLGLSICHRIVSDLRGSIEVESERGRGTVFVVRLAAAPEPA